jgi:Tfp pilus assembly protein PilX
VIALMVTLIMLALGLGVFTLVGGQQKAVADERVKESSYNLAETALESAIAYMPTASVSSTNWYGKRTTDASGTFVQRSCDQASSSSNCPSPTSVLGAFTNAKDFGSAGAQWKTEVWDNVYPNTSFYQETVTNKSTAVQYDSNGDGKFWIRAQATAGTKKKVIVALVTPRTVSTAAPYPATGIQGTELYVDPITTTSQVIDMQGTATTPGRVDLYCVNSLYPPQGSGSVCPTVDSTKGQLYPWTVSTGQPGNRCIDETGTTWAYYYAGGYQCWSTNVGADIIRLRNRAIANQTYYNNTCPTNLTGEVVFVDGDVNTQCAYTSGSSTWNSAANPGILVFGKANGITLGGNNTYYGLIYAGNTTAGSHASIVYVTGTARLQGVAIAEFGMVGESGTIYVDSTRNPGFVYDPNAFNKWNTASGSSSSSSAGYMIVPGTYREIPVN